jgi:hypothetical protein
MDFVEEIKDKRTTNFKVTKIPVGELKKFKKLCKEEFGDVYYVGIIQLMKIKEKYEDIIPLFNSLQRNIDDLQKQIDDLKPKIKQQTFGK